MTADAGELGYVEWSDFEYVQTQLDTKGTVNTLSDLAITSTASELNILDGVTTDAGELNYVDGVTSNIQTQLDGKQGSLSGSATTIDTETLLASLAMVTDSNGKVAVSAVTATELGYVSGVTSNVQTQLNTKGTVNTLSDLSITSTASELNILDGVTADAGELNYVDGVTSNIQTQLDGKQGSLSGSATTIDTETLLASLAMVTDSNGKVAVSAVTATELGYVSGVTSNVQTQLNTKGTVNTLPDLSITSTASELNILDGVTADAGELNYVDGVTSSIQTQLDAKQALDADLTDLADGTLSASKVENNEYFITSEGTAEQVWTSDGTGAGAWGSPAAVSITDNESTNEGNALIFAADAELDGGILGLESDGDATYNPSTGTIFATNFSGNLAGTLQTPAQGNVTSLGTLSVLTVDNVITDGAAIGHADDTDLITLADGSVTFTGSTVIPTADINGGAIDAVTLGTNSAVTQAVVDNINLDGAAIGHANDTDLITLADGSVTFTGSTVIPTADINGGAIDAVTLGTNSAVTQAVVDNINLDGAAIGHADDTDLITLADGSVTFTGSTVIATADINGGAIDAVTLGTNSAVTQAVVDNINLDGAAIGHADDTDLITLADGSVTFTGSTVIPTADINGGAIDGAAIGASSASTGAFTSVTRK